MHLQIVFFTASRGHHADVGGITPGSMPPTSRRLAEEGAAIISFKLVRGGNFQVRHVLWWPMHQPLACLRLGSNLSLWTAGGCTCCCAAAPGQLLLLALLQEKGMAELLLAPGKLKLEIPGISGTRNLDDNISDCKAQASHAAMVCQAQGRAGQGLSRRLASQVAANNQGIGLVQSLIEEYTLPVVQAYMRHIQVCGVGASAGAAACAHAAHHGGCRPAGEC